MVIHEESESPVEISVIRKPAVLEPKKYLVISNHVRELSNSNDEQNNDNFATDKLAESTESNLKRSKNSAKKSKKSKRDSTSEQSANCTQISESDLSELRTLYQNCLAVINKIETKYGHLLNIDKPSSSSLNQDVGQGDTCQCARNKKIIFNDDGTQHSIEVLNDDHICAAIPRKPLKVAVGTCNVETDSEDYFCSLPNELPTLAKMLHDPNLNLNSRDKIIKKINNIKQEHCIEIRFNKPALIQSVKQDPNQVLAFKGVNWSSMPGYL